MEKELNTYNCQLSSVNYQLPSPPPEAHYTVYKLTDPDGKAYIGCTGNPVEKRWGKGWKYNSKTKIFKAIRSIGWDNFEKQILCEKLTREGAGKLEKWFIAYYDSANPEKGYNRALGGLGKGVHMSKITRQLSRETKNRLYEEHPEVKARIRKTVHDLFANDPTYRERVSKGVLAAYEKDPTIKERLSVISRELWQDSEYRERCSASRRAASENPDLAEKQRAVQKRFFQEHPERKEEISRKMKEYLSKPGNRAFVESDSHAKPVICVETGEYFPSQCAAEKATGYRGIHRVCQGFQNTAGGYHWRYA